MKSVRRAAITVFLAAAIGTTQTVVPAPSVTMVVKSADRAYHVGDLVVVNVRLTNMSKQKVVFEESPKLGWSISLYRTEDNAHTDLLTAARQKNLSAPALGSNDGMAASLEVEPGESNVFRVGIETADLALQPGTYTLVVRRRDLYANVDLATPPFTLTLAERPPQ
jgi:hypothetical protein